MLTFLNAQEGAPLSSDQQTSSTSSLPSVASDTSSQKAAPIDSTRKDQTRTVSIISHYPVMTSLGEVSMPGVKLPFYDPLDDEPEVLWRLSYFKPYLAPLASPSPEISLWQASMATYTLSALTPFRVKKPFTRVRFDQSSRKTQLLSVEHAQNFSSYAGFRAVYRRRTRTGEYLGQTTDHYGAGFLLYGTTKADSASNFRFYGVTQGLWNQLYDEINGGSVFEPADGLQTAFQKESQPVRFVNGQWRTWYRLLRGEGGLAWDHEGTEKVIGLYAQVRQTYGGWRSGPARVPTSPFGTDTAYARTFAFGEEQRIGMRADMSHSGLSLQLVRWRGKGENWQSFDRQALTGEVRLAPFRFWRSPISELKLFYRYWLSAASPPPELNASLHSTLPLPQKLSSALSLQYSRLALPWFFYQRWTIPQTRNPEFLSVTYSILWRGIHGDTAQRPKQVPEHVQNNFLELRFWGLRQRWPLLIRGAWAYQSEAALFWYGMKFIGNWGGRHVGAYSAILLQRPVKLDSLRWWTRQIPMVTGWFQLHYQWRIPPFTPMYCFGVRLRGSSSHHPACYEPAYALFFASDDTPLQPTWTALDVFVAVYLRQFQVYLRVDHAAEGLFWPGSFWTYPYPVPGQAFSFGFVWDIYN